MFEIKVNVQVDVTPNVVNLVSAILGKVGTAAEPAPVEAPAPAAPAKKPRKAAPTRTRTGTRRPR